MTNLPVSELKANDTVYDVFGKGVINQNNSEGLKFWTGTREEYDSIEHSSDTVYNITDEGTTEYSANKNLSNLSSEGKNISNWSSNVTNCITEIPQDVKLELNADKTQLTVKSGSVMYYPDGFETDGTTKKFGKIILENDAQISSLHIADSDSVLVYRYKRANPGFFANMPNSASGDTHPGQHYEWYDTVNNFEGWTGNTTSGTIVDDERATFPIALLHWNNDNTIEIKQIFNGFGYIGNTSFVLPGVKCLIPNGRNTDGTLKNILYTTTSVETRSTASIGEINLNLYADGMIHEYHTLNVYNQSEEPYGEQYILWYSPETNLWKYTEFSYNMIS